MVGMNEVGLFFEGTHGYEQVHVCHGVRCQAVSPVVKATITLLETEETTDTECQYQRIWERRNILGNEEQWACKECII